MTNILSFFISAGVITLAEIADKTQLLSMCFAARFNGRKVMLGVVIGSLLNQGLAVAAGYFLKEILSAYMDIVQILTSLSFVGFGIWSLKPTEKEKEGCNTRSSLGPVLTVATAFFFAEMGDKTQLAAISLSASLGNPLLVLLGTVTGMIIANSLGVLFGSVINKKLPANAIQFTSAAVFIMFGVIGYINTARHIMDNTNVALSTLLIIFASIIISSITIRKRKLQSF